LKKELGGKSHARGILWVNPSTAPKSGPYGLLMSAREFEVDPSKVKGEKIE